MDGGACWATVHGVTKTQTRLSTYTTTLLYVKYLTKHVAQSRHTVITRFFDPNLFLCIESFLMKVG